MPGIKSGGKLDVTVSKAENAEDYKLSLAGELEPDLSAKFKIKLAVSYNDGLFKQKHGGFHGKRSSALR